ncbi:hypothetical protein L6164_000520 [Bauhinia variegata]|uniref:Uncharacterized protein n=1 Tax=Bauhinia variegata TaxID=167791 RepID=A0ACB9Q6P5_BAUVA|nr:hypothetical protein L6164_000520 [Bauhinia variegata]
MMKVEMTSLFCYTAIPSQTRHLALEKSACLGLYQRFQLHTHSQILHTPSLKAKDKPHLLLKQSFTMAEQNKGDNQPSEPLPRSYNELLGGNRPRKTSWPELVGVTAEEAERKIKEDMAGAEIQVVPPDHFVTADFRPQRVRLYVDQSQKVIRTPGIG